MPVTVALAWGFFAGVVLARFCDWLAWHIGRRHQWSCSCWTPARPGRLVDVGRDGNCNCFMICGHEPGSTPKCVRWKS